MRLKPCKLIYDSSNEMNIRSATFQFCDIIDPDFVEQLQQAQMQLLEGFDVFSRLQTRR